MASKKPAIQSEPPAPVRAHRPLLAPDVNRSNHSVDRLDARREWHAHIDAGRLKVTK